MKKKKKIISLLAASLCTGLIFAGCGEKTGIEPTPEVSVTEGATNLEENSEPTKEVLQDRRFKNVDIEKIDDEVYIFICRIKKSVIVLKNGKNIFPEEIENLVNRIEGITESFIFGKQMSNDKNDIKINVKAVINKERIKEAYKVESDVEIYKAITNKIKGINKFMPQYKAIRGIILTEEPLIKTTTNKIKRQENLDAINRA